MSPEYKQTYVKMYRAMTAHPMLAYDNNAWIVFTKLLLNVDWETGKINLGRQMLGTLCNMKSVTAWHTLLRLRDNSMITTLSNKKFTEITVVNWSKYQGREKARQQPDNTKTTPVQLSGNTLLKNKELRTKNITPAAADVVELFSYWHEQTGIEIASKIKTNQATCQGLINVHGMETMRKLILSVKQAQASKYAPRVSDFIQLNARLTELITWCKMQVQSPPAYQVGGVAKSKNTENPAAAGMTRKEMLEREYQT